MLLFNVRILLFFLEKSWDNITEEGKGGYERECFFFLQVLFVFSITKRL